MPFRHVVMFRWADHVGEEHVGRVRAAFDALPETIPEIRRYVHGADVGVSEGNFDYVVVADFDTVVDWRAYRDHPTHLVLIEELIKGHVAERAAVQYQTPGEPSPYVTSTAGLRQPPVDAGYRAGPGDLGGSASSGADESDEALLERARKAAMAEMTVLLAEPDDLA